MPFHSIVASAHNAEPYVELARTQQGVLWRKHILTRGNLIHPVTKEKINLSDDFMDTLIHNFEDKVCDTVSVPLASDQNAHPAHGEEDPDRNVGEVIGLQYNKPDGKLYALMDVRDAQRASKLGTTYLGASAMLSLDYEDTRDGAKKGPTLLHCAITNRPYLNNLDPFEKIVAASAPTLDDVALLEPQDELIPETTDKVKEEETAPSPGAEDETPAIEEQGMTLEEMLAELKSVHNIDVEALTAQAKDAETAQAAAKDATDKNAALSASLTEALKGTDIVKLSNKDDEITADDIVGAVAELAENNVQLTSRVDSLAKESATTYVEKLRDDGFILPAKFDTFVELRLTNPTLFDQLIPDKPIVALNKETGVTPPDKKAELDVDAEIARLTAPGGAAAQYIKA